MEVNRNSFSLDECKQALLENGVPPADVLAFYMQKLLEWNTKINVTGASNPADLALKHITDVWLALNALGRPAGHVADIGSGGGIPGIVLAIISQGTGVTLVERRQKKASVLSSLVSELNLERRVKVISKPFEEVKRFPEGTEFWFRGFLPGPKLAVFLSQHFPHADLGQLILMKGPAWSQEKIDIMNEPKVRRDWKERFAEASEIGYALPKQAGERLLVLV